MAGFFRAYEVAFIAADERDVVGARTNVRDEDVRIYRLRMPPPQVRALLLEYVAEANDLERTPRFYNCQGRRAEAGVAKPTAISSYCPIWASALSKGASEIRMRPP
jgi:hypothetical protein